MERIGDRTAKGQRRLAARTTLSDSRLRRSQARLPSPVLVQGAGSPGSRTAGVTKELPFARDRLHTPVVVRCPGTDKAIAPYVHAPRFSLLLPPQLDLCAFRSAYPSSSCRDWLRWGPKYQRKPRRGRRAEQNAEVALAVRKGTGMAREKAEATKVQGRHGKTRRRNTGAKRPLTAQRPASPGSSSHPASPTSGCPPQRVRARTGRGEAALYASTRRAARRPNGAGRFRRQARRPQNTTGSGGRPERAKYAPRFAGRTWEVERCASMTGA